MKKPALTRITPSMIIMLEHMATGLPATAGLSGRSAHGGSVATRAALANNWCKSEDIVKLESENESLCAAINRLKSPLKLLSAEEVTEPGWYCWRGREGEKKWVFIEFKHGLFTFENGLRFEPCPPFGKFIGPLPMEVMNVE